MKRLRLALLLAAGVTCSPAWSQCVMCFRTAAAQNAARAHVLNIGIALLGMPPFVILGGFLLLAWRRNNMFAGVEEAAETQSVSHS
jgi:hypothetical protein